VKTKMQLKGCLCQHVSASASALASARRSKAAELPEKGLCSYLIISMSGAMAGHLHSWKIVCL
jgi:hypothetical protein